MRRSARLLWAALALAVVLLLAWPLLRTTGRGTGVRPVAAWVGIERDDSGTAEIGFFELEPDEPFTLHAILEARRGEERVFFTEARSVRLAGEEISGENVRPWNGPLEARILWFTVEPQSPVLRAEGEPELRYQANYRGDWPQAWQAPGRLEPYRRRLMAADRDLEGRFGTQRYRVRIELFGPQSEIQPKERFVSAGPDELPADADDFPGAVVPLPGLLAAPSRVFGLPVVEGVLSEAGAQRVRGWMARDLAFSLPQLLQAMAVEAGRAWERLDWVQVDLAEGPPWGEGGLGAGDLVRVGSRVVVLYRDEGADGVVDGGDLCFDYHEGPSVERLEGVFTGEGLVEAASWNGGVGE